MSVTGDYIDEAVAEAYQEGIKRGRELETEAARWVRLLDGNNLLTVEEAQSYLFAIELSDGSWAYFSDAITWDAETGPEWGDGSHGWDLDRVRWYRALPAPPEAK